MTKIKSAACTAIERPPILMHYRRLQKSTLAMLRIMKPKRLSHRTPIRHPWHWQARAIFPYTAVESKRALKHFQIFHKGIRAIQTTCVDFVWMMAQDEQLEGLSQYLVRVWNIPTQEASILQSSTQLCARPLPLNWCI